MNDSLEEEFKMKFKTLKTNDELNLYSDLTYKYIDVRLPLEYLQRSKVIACFNRQGFICGGFVIVLEGPFRVITSIPNFNEQKWHHQLKNCAEVTGLWFDNSHTHKRASIKFWLTVYFELLRTKKEYFTYAWSLKKPKLGEIYAHGNPVILFRGETNILPGMDQPDHESVEIVKRRDLLLTPLLKPTFLLKRVRGTRSLKAHNQHQRQMLSRPIIHEVN